MNNNIPYTTLLHDLDQDLSKAQYYSLLLDYAQTIIIQTNITSKRDVAKDLSMSAQVFSSTFPLLVAYSNKTTVVPGT